MKLTIISLISMGLFATQVLSAPGMDHHIRQNDLKKCEDGHGGPDRGKQYGNGMEDLPHLLPNSQSKL
jgi:hypothetical protein